MSFFSCACRRTATSDVSNVRHPKNWRMRLPQEFRPVRGSDGKQRLRSRPASIGRGQMTRRRMQRGADSTAVCDMLVSTLSAFACHGGALGAAPLPGVEDVDRPRRYSPLVFRTVTNPSDAIPLEASASQGAMRGKPFLRLERVGARRHGVNLYGNEKNAGGCHPPGRDAYCRHQR
jgi:hypothetical protein